MKDALKRKTLTSKVFGPPAAYVILLLLSYAAGYFSAPKSSNSLIPPPVQLSSQPTAAMLHDFPTQLDNFRVTTNCAEPVSDNLVRHAVLKRVYNDTSPYLNFPPPHARNLIRAKRLKGWGSNGAVFRNLINKVKPRVIIEVGTFLGASALHMAELTRQLGLQTQILCIDDFRGWPEFLDKYKYVNMVNGDVLLLYQFMQNVAYYNSTETILPLPFSSASALEKLCAWGVRGDLIEIDAGHDFNSAWGDINRAYRILRPGGVIFGHDYFTAADNRGVRRAVKLFAEMNGLEIKIDGQHWVIHSSK